MKINDNIDSLEKYKISYKKSIQSSENFWDEKAERLNWYKKWNKTKSSDFVKGEIEWFIGGEINASYNCLDRHIENGFGNEIAIIWEGNDPDHSRSFTYNELLKKVSEFANALKDLNVKKGDRVCLYMQMIPELAIAVLACARIGAVHSVVFGAFSSDSLRDRINDSKCKVLVTQDTGVRGEKQNIFMKKNADNAVKETPSINHVIVVRRTGEPVHMDNKKDIWWHEAISNVSSKCKPEKMSSEDPLFILYTSGSTGKPKGVMHTTGGYLVYASYTHEIVFDYKPGDIYWCTADLGWITGHSYIVYGPLSNRATTLMFEGVPNYPDYGRFWEIVDKHKVNQFYTAPTALRALMKEGNKWVNNKDLRSLRLLGTVGEPIKEPEWNWYSRIIGKNNCPIVDTWWQTETGGILITPIPNVTPTKPGSATFPFFGIEPVLLTDEGEEILGNNVSGLLAIKNSWPGQMRTIYGDHKRFIDVYFSKFPGYYFTGDGAKRDRDGYYWITGRVDDILCVSGHNIGTAEVEGAIGKANGVAEAAVVGYTHDVKGHAICAFVTLMTGLEPDDMIYNQILDSVTKEIGPHAKPDKIHFTPSLPKTRSGKIMRRILRKISEGDFENLGDITTLADPGIVKDIISSLR
ncbi:acetate--CoA ligase [Candidatus Marinimicrobia bacterium]|jgi:acetyl-CoA synthetase|nr:acetate--CoA ligase [Candidatus Neomarinimicrobiota bacterium]MDC0383425.1 acetate--CoA ligase [Candidatus Neomarinimicrobiota bacterium]